MNFTEEDGLTIEVTESEKRKLDAWIKANESNPHMQDMFESLRQVDCNFRKMLSCARERRGAEKEE